MHVVVVSSPGGGSGRDPVHWSRPFAASMAAQAAAAGASVLWLEPVRAAAGPVDVPAGIAHRLVRLSGRSDVHRVAADNRHLELELELTRELRARPTAVVVHVGVGARGSPNIGWLADRLGSRSFAVARAAEVVCQRGDLVHRDGSPCTVVDDADRCRRCCAAGWLRRPHADDVRTRGDLLIASLQAAVAVFVTDASDGERLRAFGLHGATWGDGLDPSAILARILAA